MTTTRLEAFSDGVLAIVITIMVLEMKIPEGDSIMDLIPLLPTFLTYVLSFVYIGIYWNNHHHLMHASERVNGKVLWANLHLLFWLSLLPFATGFMGVNHFERWPTVLYGTVLFSASVAWHLLFLVLKAQHDGETLLRKAYGKSTKAYVSIGSYALATALGFIWPIVSVTIYLLVAIIWLVPNKKLEKKL